MRLKLLKLDNNIGENMKTKNLIAPCGMNCALCQAYQGKGSKCFDCGNMSKRKS